MKTKLLKDDISEASDIIKAGGTVAVPTETVYGLAANGLDEAAVKRIYELKGRPKIKPLSLMVSGAEAIDGLCEDVPPAARRLADIFWPGPLTIVLKANEKVPEIVRAGGKSLGLRCPNHPKTLQLLKETGLPLAAPSANPSGQECAKTAQEALNYFDGKIDAVIDGGPCALGIESTVFDMSQTPYKILREGGIGAEYIDMALTAHLSLIGITGGTGGGKTTALDILHDMGVLVIDSDEVYHTLLKKSDEMLEALNKRFPGAIPEGTRDTKTLGEIVFSDPVELSALNAITHSFVGKEINRRLADWAKNGGQAAAIDAIGLIEGGVGQFCTATVAVTAPMEMRIQRLMSREGISREYAELRINAQKPNEFFRENCDYTLENDSDKESFKTKCQELFIKILRRDINE